MSKSPMELAARALCRLDGLPENATMEGRPLWENYLPEVRAVLTAIREPSEDMVAAGEAWRTHCSDIDTLFGEMIKVAIHGSE